MFSGMHGGHVGGQGMEDERMSLTLRLPSLCEVVSEFECIYIYIYIYIHDYVCVCIGVRVLCVYVS